MDKTKLYKYYNIGIQSAIIIVAIVLLYGELSGKSILEYQGLLKIYFKSSQFVWLFILVVLLMPINWFLEAAKWRYIVSTKEQISFALAVKAIFAGASVSALSPNRIGDFLGRVFVLKKTSFLQGAFITLIGSFAQTLISLIIGFMAFAYLEYYDPNVVNTNSIFLLSIPALLILILIFVYFKISILSRIIPQSWKKTRTYVEILSQYRFPQLTTVFIYSFIRYLVFSTQFVLMLWAVGIHFAIFHLYIIVFTIFFVNMFRPSVAIVEFAIRGAVSVTVMDMYYAFFLDKGPAEHTNIIIASTLIWLVNIILPAIIGLFFIKDMKFFKHRKKSS